MPSGPKPLAAVEHLNRNNPSKKNKEDLKASASIKVEVPDCPLEVNDYGRQEWVRITHELSKLGLVAKIDLAVLAVYCMAWATWREAQNEINIGGLIQDHNTGPRRSPWLNIRNDAAKELLRCASQFGLSPAERTRVIPRLDDSDTGKSRTASYFND